MRKINLVRCGVVLLEQDPLRVHSGILFLERVPLQSEAELYFWSGFRCRSEAELYFRSGFRVVPLGHRTVEKFMLEYYIVFGLKELE